MMNGMQEWERNVVKAIGAATAVLGTVVVAATLIIKAWVGNPTVLTNAQLQSLNPGARQIISKVIDTKGRISDEGLRNAIVKEVGRVAAINDSLKATEDLIKQGALEDALDRIINIKGEIENFKYLNVDDIKERVLELRKALYLVVQLQKEQSL